MRRKGESLGADRQLSKPEIGNLVSVIDELVRITDAEWYKYIWIMTPFAGAGRITTLLFAKGVFNLYW